MLEEAAMVAWGVWQARNAVVWNQNTSTAATIVLSARRALDQYQFAQSTKDGSLLLFRDNNKAIEHWTTPVNVNGAIFEQFGRYGVGYTTRDHDGKVLAAFNKSFEGRVQSEMAKIIGIKEALSWIDSFS
uniref:RNase H type-1 domain-containing protein n=1 Tax=Cannabis sativa TaxID=3483 RepID=A0A803Q4T8_CANSA